jgi:hypothetical protein
MSLPFQVSGNKYRCRDHVVITCTDRKLHMTKKILNEVRDELIAMGLAQNEPEFCVAWLGRGIGYMRTLRHLRQEPSAEALVILASKLQHYTQRLWLAGEGKADWAARFDVLHQHCRAALEQHARDRWQTLERMSYGA